MSVNMYDAQRGMQQAEVARPEYQHETNARNWTQAKNRLDDALRKLAEAKSEETAAGAAEESAWQDLHESSGRIPPRAQAAKTNLR